MTRRLDQLKDLASQWSQAGGVGHLGQRMNKIMAAIEAQTRKLHDLREIASDRNAVLAKVNQLDNILGQLNDVYDQVTRQYGSLIETYRNREIDRVIAQHHNELGGIQRKLTEYRSVEGVVNDLESSLGDVGEKLDSFKYLVNALSPTDGLIAKQLTSFIGCLTEQINSITSSIWEYDIQVLPCGMESGGLDYKFPVQIKSSGNRIPDISKGSKAQKHLINLAFQQIVMLYKNMTDYPLYLDEPGEGFDEQHRSNLMAFIKRLMDNNYYSQLFMISHYASSHGAFAEAQVMVLDSTNIALTREFNQHVVLG
jgi:DNA repair exonuclease SbcCD ATPase subunit